MVLDVLEAGLRWAQSARDALVEAMRREVVRLEAEPMTLTSAADVAALQTALRSA